MDPAIAWAVAGLALVISELLTGTFYLLMLAVAAFGAAAGAYFGHSFPIQCVIAAAVAAAGCYAVHLYRVKNRTPPMAPVDAGMPATFENWIDMSARLARVRYRGASWDARIDDSEAIEPGATLYVVATEGNTLKVSKKYP